MQPSQPSSTPLTIVQIEVPVGPQPLPQPDSEPSMPEIRLCFPLPSVEEIEKMPPISEAWALGLAEICALAEESRRRRAERQRNS